MISKKYFPDDDDIFGLGSDSEDEDDEDDDILEGK